MKDIPTDRQYDVLEYVVQFVTRFGFPPSLREIANYLDIASTNAVKDHLVALDKKGYIVRYEHTPRGIQITQKGLEMFGDTSEVCAR